MEEIETKLKNEGISFAAIDSFDIVQQYLNKGEPPIDVVIKQLKQGIELRRKKEKDTLKQFEHKELDINNERVDELYTEFILNDLDTDVDALVSRVLTKIALRKRQPNTAIERPIKKKFKLSEKAKRKLEEQEELEMGEEYKPDPDYRESSSDEEEYCEERAPKKRKPRNKAAKAKNKDSSDDQSQEEIKSLKKRKTKKY